LYEDLSLFECLSIAEIIFDNFDDLLLLVKIVVKFLKDRCQSSWRLACDLLDLVIAEFEEHGQKFLVYNFNIEQRYVVAKVWRELFLCSPVVLGIVVCFKDSIDKLSALLRIYLGQEHVHILQCSNTDLIQIALQELLKDRQ